MRIMIRYTAADGALPRDVRVCAQFAQDDWVKIVHDTIIVVCAKSTSDDARARSPQSSATSPVVLCVCSVHVYVIRCVRAHVVGELANWCHYDGN